MNKLTFKEPISIRLEWENDTGYSTSLILPPLSFETCDFAACDDYGNDGYIAINLDKYLTILNAQEIRILIALLREHM